MVTISRLTADELTERIAQSLVDDGISLDDFIRQGSEGALTDPSLIDLWHLWGDSLLEIREATAVA